jgi:hypothetical protein
MIQTLKLLKKSSRKFSATVIVRGDTPKKPKQDKKAKDAKPTPATNQAQGKTEKKDEKKDDKKKK